MYEGITTGRVNDKGIAYENREGVDRKIGSSLLKCK